MSIPSLSFEVYQKCECPYGGANILGLPRALFMPYNRGAKTTPFPLTRHTHTPCPSQTSVTTMATPYATFYDPLLLPYPLHCVPIIH
jgi:hypothetical protein